MTGVLGAMAGVVVGLVVGIVASASVEATIGAAVAGHRAPVRAGLRKPWQQAAVLVHQQRTPPNGPTPRRGRWHPRCCSASRW